jgi:DNA-binding transcriptional MerR regulator
MTIKDACEATGLTRKAIRYYEGVGLIQPEVDTRGYRNYTPEVVKQLALIAMLRGFDLSVEAIRNCMQGEEALSAQLKTKLSELETEREQMSTEAELLREFLDGERSLAEIADLRRRVEATLRNRPGYLCEQLRRLFPGDFGEVLAAVFGGMLNQRLETPEQHAAWLTLVDDLDQTEQIEVPDAIADWARQRNDCLRIEDKVSRMMEEYAQDYESFSRQKREAAEEYLATDGAREELRAFTERSEMVSSFLAGPGLSISLAMGKHLQVLSDGLAQFAEKGQRFIRENPELIRRLMGE